MAFPIIISLLQEICFLSASVRIKISKFKQYPYFKYWYDLTLKSVMVLLFKFFYVLGLSKWVRNKVQGFTSCKQAIDSISRFAKDRIKDMPVIK